MRAMVLHEATDRLRLEEVEDPRPQAHQVRIAVEACGVCRTNLHIVNGELRDPAPPLIPGHEIVGRVAEIGADVSGFAPGQRVGVPWLGHSCGTCLYCAQGEENVCDAPGFTGYTLNSGYAEACVADAAFVFALDDQADAAALAPLLCAGLIGFRSLRMAGEAKKAGALWLWGGRAYPGAVRRLAGARGLRLHAPGRRGSAGFRPGDGCGLGRRVG